MKIKILLFGLLLWVSKISAQQMKSEAEPNAIETPAFILSQNYPNPAKEFTRIKFQLNSSGHVSLKLYDMLGKPVYTLLDQQMYVGTYSIPLETADLAEGIYFYELKKDSTTQTQRMIISK